MDSMMIGSNPVDTQNNFTGPNSLVATSDVSPLSNEALKPLTDEAYARKILRQHESTSRKYRRAQKALEAAIKDLKGAGRGTLGLEGELARVKKARDLQRIKRELARDVWREAAQKATA